MIIRNAIHDGQSVDIEVLDGLISAIVSATGGFHSGDIQAGGARVLPGFWDEHVHIRSWAQYLARAKLNDAPDPDAVVEILRAHPTYGREPIIGHGLRYALWKTPPQQKTLDAVSKDRPVIAFSLDVHSVWVNTAAMREYDLGAHVDGDTGIIREQPCFDLLVKLADIPEAEMDGLVRAAAHDARAKGIVGITSFEMESLTDWDRRVANGFDTIRVNASLYPDRIAEAYDRGLRTGDTVDGLVRMGFLKVITDGAINTKTAYLHDPYVGSDSVGGLNTEVDELNRLTAEAAANGIVPALHAIGDRANTVVIDAFEKAGIGGRIEHAQMVRPEDQERMARLGIAASIQPTHAVDDRDVADAVWGERVEYAYPMKSLLRRGVDVILSSDAPVAPLDPWLTMRMATNRTDDSRPAWHPEEALTVDEAIACSARSTLAVGQPADLVIVEGETVRVTLVGGDV